MTGRGGEEREPGEGGHAAERLEEFVRERFPGGLPPEERPVDEPSEEQEEGKGTSEEQC
jgi:hypothetical protein